MVPLRARYRKIPAPLDGIVGAVNSHFGLERADRNLVEKTLLNCLGDRQGRRRRQDASSPRRPNGFARRRPASACRSGPTGKRFFFDTPEVRRKIV